MLKRSVLSALTAVVLASTLFGQSNTSTKAAQVAPKDSKSKTSGKANTVASRDLVQGKLFIATLFTVGAGNDHPYLWIKSDAAQYEIVLTEKTSLPSGWRQKRDGDDGQYPVTLIGVEGVFYLEPEPETMQVTHNANGSITRRLNIHDAGSDHENRVTTLMPLVGNYSVRGQITMPSQGGATGQISASEIKVLEK